MMNSMKKIIVVGTMFGLWSCAPYDHTHEPDGRGPDVDKPPRVGELTDNRVYIGGVNVDELAADSARLRPVIQDLLDIDINTDEGQTALESLRERLDNGIRSGDDSRPLPEPLQGLGGIYVRSLFNAFRGLSTEWSGLTGDILRNEETGAGHLSVDVVEKVFELGAKIPIETNIWHMDIDVAASKLDKYGERIGGFQVHKIAIDPSDVDPDGSGSVPFPDVNLVLPKPTLLKIKEKGLDHKLHAGDQSVTIRAVYKNYVLLDEIKHPNYYRLTNNCIDMLTKDTPPKNVIELRDLQSIGLMCMGRCGDRVPIMNTP